MTQQNYKGYSFQLSFLVYGVQIFFYWQKNKYSICSSVKAYSWYRQLKLFSRTAPRIYLFAKCIRCHWWASFSFKSFSHKITQVLTGHCKLNFFLNSIGKTLDPTCSCRKGIETVNHYLLKCENEEINRSDTIKKLVLRKEYLTRQITNFL